MAFSNTSVLKKNKYMVYLGQNDILNKQDMIEMYPSFHSVSPHIIKKIGTSPIIITEDSFVYDEGRELYICNISAFESLVYIVLSTPGEGGDTISIDNGDGEEYAIILIRFDDLSNTLEWEDSGSYGTISNIYNIISSSGFEFSFTNDSSLFPEIMPFALVGGDLSIKESIGESINMAYIPDMVLSKNIEANLPIFDLIVLNNSSKVIHDYPQYLIPFNISLYKIILLVEIVDDIDMMNMYAIEIDDFNRMQIENIVQANEPTKANLVFKSECMISEGIQLREE